MAKISISNVLRSKRRFRIATALACLALIFVLGQTVVSRSPKSVKAVAGWPTLTKNVKCVSNSSATNIPVDCEFADVTIDGAATVDAFAIKIDNSGGTPVECFDIFNIQCDSKRQFKSLKLQNGAVLLHKGLATGDIIELDRFAQHNVSLASNTQGSARWKKVDFVVSGDVQILSGSKIDVSGKGYPGGDGHSTSLTDENGYGPAYGHGGGFNTRGGNAGGGGYGGVGEVGSDNIAGGSPPYGDKTFPNPSDFEWGSGGGGLWGHGGEQSVNGGAGGGRIRIDAESIYLDYSSGGSMILANGAGGEGFKESYAGGGAGGSIVLTFSKAFVNYHPTAQNIRTDLYSTGVGSIHYIPNSLGQEDYSPIDNTNTNVQAMGGGNLWNGTGGYGGGGRIYFAQTGTPLVTVSKSLSAYSRNGVLATTTPFNPYALQVGDIINVNIKLGTFTPPLDLTDELLHSISNKCSFVDAGNVASITPAAVDEANNIIKFYLTSVPAGSTFYYRCKVR